MSFFTILENLFIGPLKLIFEVIFYTANVFTANPGVAIIFLSLVMNILVLPLYRRADAMQEAARDVDMKLRDGVSHIKKTFSGDERMMILQTYYRQNNYKPTDALNGSVSLLLEIPFFMAAYQFLSGLDALNGVSFGPITDLGKPDGLMTIAGFTVNLLPILMTLINVISSALYLKGFPLKTKIQLYGMAAFFLVFLYTSPACLVFYWTLNNVFSLVKTIFYKLKNPQKVLRILTTVSGIMFILYGVFMYDVDVEGGKLFVVAIGALLQLPLLFHAINSVGEKRIDENVYTPNKKIFVLGGILLTVLVGVLIPSAFISASPQEFIDSSYFHNPLWYIVSSASMAAGFFLVWFGVFYWLASPKGKVFFERIVWILSGVGLVDYMFFGTELGVISSMLQYENGMNFGMDEYVINAAVICSMTLLLLFVIIKFKKVTATVMAVVTVALSGMSAINVFAINSSVKEFTSSAVSDSMAEFQLSKTGKNVVVIMLDRGMNEYIPYIFKEKPKLKKKFDGFTYYNNVISFGGYTNLGTPALLGGYEYTPVEMNKRDDELLVDKHNEALKVMPVIFDSNGFETTVCDPVYAGYTWIPDLSIYDEYPDIDKYITKGAFAPEEQKLSVINNNYRNFFCLGLTKSAPLFLQPALYNGGKYNQIAGETDYSNQSITSTSTSTGYSSIFMESYNVMANLATITKISEESKNTFLFLSNEMTHEPALLQTPDYVPAGRVDNTEYDTKHNKRFEIDGRDLDVSNTLQMSHYHINMAAMLRLGEWFDHLRKNGVYDNTRIIIVSDHGRDVRQMDELYVESPLGSVESMELYYPMLMVKDFNSKKFTTSNEFMTNADVPTLAMKDIINYPINPFTGKPINSDEKYAHDQFISMSYNWSTSSNKGKTYAPSQWVSVKDNVWDKSNWTIYPYNTVLKDHKFD